MQLKAQLHVKERKQLKLLTSASLCFLRTFESGILMVGDADVIRTEGADWRVRDPGKSIK